MKNIKNQCNMDCSSCSTLSSKAKKANEPQKIKSVDLESLVAETILSFCENVAELGYRPVVGKVDDGCDMWFRERTEKEQFDIASKLLEIIKRNMKMAKVDRKNNNGL